MKHLLGIGLLISLFAPFAGLWSWFQLQKYQVRKEVQNTILPHAQKEDLILLKFTQTESERDLRWEHAREFEYNEQMYDIVETHVQGDSIFYLCWADHKETAVNTQMKNLIRDAAGQDQPNQENQKRLTDFFKTLIHDKGSEAFIVSRLRTLKPYFFYALHVLQFNIPPPTPPPETGGT